MSVRGTLATILKRKEVKLPEKTVHNIIDGAHAPSWFKYAFDRREEYWIGWKTCFWLARRLSAHVPILESGCGCGFNLLWFGQHGFRRLAGFDNDPAVLAAGRALAQLAEVPIEFWEDNALAPACVPDIRFGAILAINWTYLLSEFDLHRFFAEYSDKLGQGGYIALDAVDTSYKTEPRNMFCTQDWALPEAERRPSEYPIRYSSAEVLSAGQRAGLSHTVTISSDQPEAVPKVVYVFQNLKN